MDICKLEKCAGISGSYRLPVGKRILPEARPRALIGITYRHGYRLLLMHGDYAQDMGHDGMKRDIVTVSKANQGAGHWWEWRENGDFGNTVGFANAHLERVGACRFSFEDSRYLKLPVDAEGREMQSPFGNVRESVQPSPDLK